MTCPRCQQDNPSHAKFCLACGVPLRRTSESGPSGMSYVQMQGALTEALEQQTATSEVLKVISRSAFDLLPVLETLLENAARLCAAEWGVIFRPDGDAYRMAAVYGASAEFKEFLTRTPIPPGRGSGVGRAAHERRPVQVADVSADAEYRVTEFQRIGGFRTVLAVPMLREGALLGVFGLHRDQVRPFTEKQIQLVSTFADQAAIAIENVRLFTELQTRNHDLTEALDRQTATSEILSVISSSPTEIQPVFDAIIRSAVRLSGASHGGVYRFAGELIHSVAHDGFTPEQLEQWRKTWPRPATGSRNLASEAIRTRSVVRSGDIEATTIFQLSAEARANLRSRGSRSVLAVPMIRQDKVIGVIGLAHPGVEAFSDSHVELLKIFADQAVIAIENVRLFKELEARNRDLTEALEQQTATSEILRVISASPTDEQPVFEAIVESARRLCEAAFSGVFLVEDGQLVLAAVRGVDEAGVAAMRHAYPRPIARDTTTGRAILDQAMVHIPDSTLDPTYTHPLRETIALRAILTVP